MAGTARTPITSPTGALKLAGTTGISSQLLTQGTTFENGTRFQAGSYPVVVLSGSYREMGGR